jgi:hypothetical protein
MNEQYITAAINDDNKLVTRLVTWNAKYEETTANMVGEVQLAGNALFTLDYRLIRRILAFGKLTSDTWIQ